MAGNNNQSNTLVTSSSLSSIKTSSFISSKLSINAEDLEINGKSINERFKEMSDLLAICVAKEECFPDVLKSISEAQLRQHEALDKRIENISMYNIKSFNESYESLKYYFEVYLINVDISDHNFSSEISDIDHKIFVEYLEGVLYDIVKWDPAKLQWFIKYCELLKCSEQLISYVCFRFTTDQRIKLDSRETVMVANIELIKSKLPTLFEYLKELVERYKKEGTMPALSTIVGFK